MAVFKCKMCGGALEIGESQSVSTCEYCGTQQTLPKLDDEKRAQLYDRANYSRRENEFDKAMGIYEMILSEEKTDSEAYWGIVLCRYGIEYVEDPRTHKRIPTVNRAQFTSIFDDANYKNALQYADSLQKVVYEEEATVIDKIQKGILSISQKEEPFDVFICYKETDNSGNRTQDSVYAQDIYTALTKEGYKVFFSRITLEDKLGSAYEPYIFAALNSAEVMLVVGTNKENFSAVWVKNEWSRYLNLIKAGKEKTLIPVYKNISPYEMPEEFQFLQSQDLGKIGAIQDIVHGVSKLVDVSESTVKETVVVNSGNTQIEPFLKRVFMFLEDGEWRSADEYCEKVLDIDPECGQAYLGKLMVEMKINNKLGFNNCSVDFEENKNYKKIITFGDENIKLELKENLLRIKNETNEKELKEKEKLYIKANNIYEHSNRLEDIERAEKIFRSISEYKDSDIRMKKCTEKYEVILNDRVYQQALENIKNGEYTEAIEDLNTIPDWRDSKKLINDCKDMMFKEERKASNKHNLALALITIISLLTILILIFDNIYL